MWWQRQTVRYVITFIRQASPPVIWRSTVISGILTTHFHHLTLIASIFLQFIILRLHLLCVCCALNSSHFTQKFPTTVRSEACLPDLWSMKRTTLGPSLTTPKSSTTRGDLRVLHAPTSSLLNLFRAICEDGKKQWAIRAHFETRQWKKTESDMLCHTFLTANLKPVLTSWAMCTSP